MTVVILGLQGNKKENVLIVEVTMKHCPDRRALSKTKRNQSWKKRESKLYNNGADEVSWNNETPKEMETNPHNLFNNNNCDK